MSKFDIVVFDLDSTLVSFEGLDWLAELKGKGEEVSALTKSSMEGSMSVNEAFTKKMRIISPYRKDFIKLGKKYSSNLVEGVEEVVSVLHKLGKEVWIVTGNFRPAVEIFANKMQISPERVICNEVYFDSNGKYLDFDDKNPLANNGGKRKMIAERIKIRGKVVFIGDAITDLEAKDEVDMFVGFGGVVQREIVKNNSEVYFESNSMIPLLKFILNEDEIIKLQEV